MGWLQSGTFAILVSRVPTALPVVSSPVVIAIMKVSRFDTMVFIMRPLCGHVGMNHDRAICPSAHPRPPVDQNVVLTPAKPNASPAPGSKRRSDRERRTETDSSVHVESRPRTHIHDARIVDRHAV